jgi:hypothetical protein
MSQDTDRGADMGEGPNDRAIRELVKLESRIEALETFNKEIRPQIDRLQRPDRGWMVGASAVVIAFSALLSGLQHNIQQSDSHANALATEHNGDHIKSLEERIAKQREYVDSREKELRDSMFSKEDHAIFDRERKGHLDRIDDRLQWLERSCVGKPFKP